MIDAEAAVVRTVYELFTVQHLSIGAITRWLNEQGDCYPLRRFTLGAQHRMGDAA